MAIIVSKKTRAIIGPTFTPYEGLCRTHTVVINSNGSVNTPTLDLGYMNENGVTVINIDTSNLIWNTLVDSDVELFDAYQPILTFEHEDGSRLALDCLVEGGSTNGNVFIVSSALTAKAGQYKINFILRERTTDEETYPGNVGAEDDLNYSEVFASATFLGTVTALPYSTWETDFQAQDVTNLIYQNPVALQKPTIVLDWNSNKWIAPDTQIGYVGDNLMTPIQFKGLPKDDLDNCKVTVFMYNHLVSYKFVFEHNENIPISMPLTIWTPQAITDPNYNPLETNIWNCALKVEKEGKVAYTDIVPLKILNTIILSTELDTNDEEILSTTETSEAHLPLHAEFTTTRPYILDYSGDVVNEAVGLVSNNREILGSLDTYINDKINVKFETEIIQAINDTY